MKNIDALMREKHATNEALAARAGVWPQQVHKARHGLSLRQDLLDCIIEALERFTYQYNKRGPKS